jgi:hypothetical protein
LVTPVTVAELSQEAQVTIKYEIPERCLLAQAAIYVARGDVPIPDEIYLASPAQSVGWSDQLIWALRAGRLHARGNLFRGLYFERNGSLRLLSLEIEDAAIRPEFWSRELIDLPISSIRADVNTVCSNYGVSGDFEFGLTEEEEDEDPDVCFVFSQITVATKDLFELFPTQHTPSKSPLIVNKDHVANVGASGGRLISQTQSARGRPPEYNWIGVRTELAAYVSKHGPMRKHVELMQKCADFATDQHPEGKTPNDATIRAAIKKHALDIAAGLTPGK